MRFEDRLIGILRESVRRNGEKPLTNKWLLNILLMAERKLDEREHQDWIAMSDSETD